MQKHPTQVHNDVDTPTMPGRRRLLGAGLGAVAASMVPLRAAWAQTTPPKPLRRDRQRL